MYDLKAVLAQMREAQSEYIGSADADLEVKGEVPFPAAVLWQYYVDVDKRLRWQPFQTGVQNQPNAGGRMGVGASSHCAHGEAGDALREYLDWRPFKYFTNRFTPLPNGFEVMPRSVETTEFMPLENGATSVCWRIKLEDRSEAAVRYLESLGPLLQESLPKALETLSGVLEEDGFVPAAATS